MKTNKGIALRHKSLTKQLAADIKRREYTKGFRSFALGMSELPASIRHVDIDVAVLRGTTSTGKPKDRVSILEDLMRAGVSFNVRLLTGTIGWFASDPKLLYHGTPLGANTINMAPKLTGEPKASATARTTMDYINELDT